MPPIRTNAPRAPISSGPTDVAAPPQTRTTWHEMTQSLGRADDMREAGRSVTGLSS